MRLAPTTVGGTRAMATESAYAYANPVSADVVIRSFAGPQLVTIDEPTENLIHQLRDRKSTRLNSSHGYISYAVFCLKKKKTFLWRGQKLDRYPIADLSSGRNVLDVYDLS